jgi:hypothetical protein
MKHTTPTTVLFFNLTGFPITISVTSIATNVNGCGIGIMGNTLTMDVDKTENKIQTVHVYPYAFKDVDTRDYFSSDNSITNSKTEREKIYELLKYQNDIFWKDDKELEYYKCNNKKIIWNPLFHHLITYRMKKIENAVHRRQEKIFKQAVNIERAEKINAVEIMKKKDDNIYGILGDEQQNDGAPTSDWVGLNEDEKLKARQIGINIHDKTVEEVRIHLENAQISGMFDERFRGFSEGLEVKSIGLNNEEREIRERHREEVREYIMKDELKAQVTEKLEKFWDNKKLKIGTINRNLRLTSAMIDPCSHRYYLTIRIHDTDEGRLIMKDNIHRTNYDIIIRHEDIKRPSKKTETTP